MPESIVVLGFKSYEVTVVEALDKIGAGEVIAKQKRVIIKPNLVTDLPPPVTTPPELCEVIVNYVRKVAPNTEVVIAEGCGEADGGTEDVFKSLGYTELAKKLGVPLIDLNLAPLIKLSLPGNKVFREFYIPEIAMDSYIISVPMLKAHSLSVFTGSMKNMMGFAPPKYYQAGGHWKKSMFHNRMQEAILDLNRYRKADLTVFDATIGLEEYHLGGKECYPRINKILAGYDPQEVDRAAAKLLGINWQKVMHLNEKI
ncbi:MAG: DUF362 domain-containing protein [Elusimicrobiota bacterium]